nr:MAG TPA: hypothetical protein [Caudoviricetes sp.]
MLTYICQDNIDREYIYYSLSILSFFILTYKESLLSY